MRLEIIKDENDELDSSCIEEFIISLYIAHTILHHIRAGDYFLIVTLVSRP